MYLSTLVLQLAPSMNCQLHPLPSGYKYLLPLYSLIRQHIQFFLLASNLQLLSSSYDNTAVQTHPLPTYIRPDISALLISTIIQQTRASCFPPTCSNYLHLTTILQCRSILFLLAPNLKHFLSPISQPYEKHALFLFAYRSKHQAQGDIKTGSFSLDKTPQSQKIPNQLKFNMVSFTRKKIQEVVDEKTLGIEFMNEKEAQVLAYSLSDIFEVLKAEEIERAFLVRDEVLKRLHQHRDLQAEAVHIVETTLNLFERNGHKEAHNWLRRKTRDEFRVTDQYFHFGDDVTFSWRWKSEEEKKKIREGAQGIFADEKASAEAKTPALEKGPATSTAPPSQEAELTTKQSTLPSATVTGNRKRAVVDLLESEDDQYDHENTSAPKRSKPSNRPSKIVKIKLVNQDGEDNTKKPRRLPRAAASQKGHNASIPDSTGSQISTKSLPEKKTLKGGRDMPRELKDKLQCTQWIAYSELYHDEKIFAYPPGDLDRGHFILRCNMGMCNNPLFFANPLLFSNGKHHFERHGFSYAERNAMEDMIHDFGFLGM